MEDSFASLPLNAVTLDISQWTGVDDTAYIQEMLDNYEILLFPSVEGSWVTEPLFIQKSNREIYFQAGAVLEAKEGSFLGRSDSLITFENVENISIYGLGEGAVMKMHRKDYRRSPYIDAEWRHGIKLLSVTDFTISGMVIEQTGGDGIYIGVSKKENSKSYCENIKIENCIIDRNYRQGVSIISVKNLLIDKCQILNTQGTAPQSAIDFEPNHNYERLQNCVISNSILRGNWGSGFLVWLIEFDTETVNTDIQIINCDLRTNLLGINIGGLKNSPRGEILIENIKKPFLRNHIPKNSQMNIIRK